MDKLYLIRVDMERFLGPYTLKQVKEAFGRMEFGLQDEIAGSLRQWVAFDDFESIRKRYPELVQLVQKEMFSGWGVSSQSTIGSSQLPIKTKSVSRSKSSWVIWLLVGALSLVLSAVAIVLYKDGQLNSLLSMIKDRQLYTAKSLYGDRYNAKFEAFMDRSHDAINLALKKKKSSPLWIPYVRAVAFEKDGRWEGVSPKKLRGQADGFLPQDCSMSAWEQRWKDSRDQWTRFVDGREFPREEWANLLAVDPHWIHLRSPTPGWLSPGSFVEACLQMGIKSLQRMTGDNVSLEAKNFISRMRWQLGSVNAQTPDEEFEMSGTLWALSCLDDAREEAKLKNCLDSVNAKQGWREVFEISVLHRKLALAIAGKVSLDPEQLESFQLKVAELGNRTATYFLPQEPELKFYQEIVQQQGNITQARIVLDQKYPQMNFAQ